MVLRKKGNEAEESSSKEELIKILTTNMDDVFIVLSGSTYGVEYVSPNVERALGVPEKDVQRDIRNLGRAKYVDDKEVNFDTLDKIGIGGSVSHTVAREHKKTKEVRYFKETVYHVKEDKQDVYVVMISDRTAELLSKQSLEEALSIARIANRSKSAFLANMSHDIRTPMNSIVGLCTLLQRDSGDPDKIKEHVKHIMLTSRHMLTLINDILDMSKIETGDATLNVTDISLVDLIKEIDAHIAPQAKAKRQTLKTKVIIKNDRFLGDKVRIKRVLLNILSNAVKYTPEGGNIDFTVQQLARPSRKHIYLQFVVKDSGKGMSENMVRKIFEPYSRELGVTESEGTGLGMAVAKSLIDLMGGTISVDSKEGEGSTFSVNFKFPLAKINDVNFWVENNISRVLVVDDNNVDSNSITWAMRKTEVNVSIARNVRSAKTMIEKALNEGKGYNIVIYGWTSSDEEAIKGAKELRENIPEYVPLIVLGDREAADMEPKFVGLGVDGYLSKPFTVDIFRECVAGLQMSIREGLVPKTSKRAFEGMRFLVAEDNELNAMVISEILSMLGASCVVRVNGKEAVEEFENSKSGQYDCVLMDVQMPVMNGYDAARAIRSSSHADAKNMPIVAMTANAFAEDVKNSLDAGMNAYLLKPVDISKLQETVLHLKGGVVEDGE